MAPPRDGDLPPKDDRSVDYASKFADACNNYDCSLIYTRFNEYNKRPIKPKEAAILRGLLQIKNPDTIAKDLGRSCGALRQDLKVMYPYFARTFEKDWDGFEMGWYLIPLWAVQQGFYKFSSLEVVLTLMSKPSDFGVDDLILFISQKQQEKIIRKDNMEVDQEKINRLKTYIDNGDKNDRLGRYQEALKDYEWVIRQAPFHYLPVLVKIAIVLEKKKAHADAYKLAHFSLGLMQSQYYQGILYNIIAGAHHDVALSQNSEATLNQAMGYYDLSLKCSHDELEIIYPAWNGLELLIDFGLQSKNLLCFNQAIVKAKELSEIKTKFQSYPNFEDKWNKFTENSVKNTLNKIKADIVEDSPFFSQLSYLNKQIDKLFPEVQNENN